VLSLCRQRVEDANCQVGPAWYNAFLLVPLTQEHYEELNLKLEHHHVLALECDRGALEAALLQVPCRLRPQVKTDHRADAADHIEMSPSVATASDSVGVMAEAGAAPMHSSVEHAPCLQVVRTFLHFPLPALVTEISSSNLVHSDPADIDPGLLPTGFQQQLEWRGSYGDTRAFHAQNPRRWG
jgi:hypothetical protein